MHKIDTQTITIYLISNVLRIDLNSIPIHTITTGHWLISVRFQSPFTSKNEALLELRGFDSIHNRSVLARVAFSRSFFPKHVNRGIKHARRCSGKNNVSPWASPRPGSSRGRRKRRGGKKKAKPKRRGQERLTKIDISKKRVPAKKEETAI